MKIHLTIALLLLNAASTHAGLLRGAGYNVYQHPRFPVPTLKQASHKCLYSPAPDFPAEAQRKGEHGSGLYRLIINTKNGEVTEVRVQKSSGFRDLDASAVWAFFKWKFQPNSVAAVDVPWDFNPKR